MLRNADSGFNSVGLTCHQPRSTVSEIAMVEEMVNPKADLGQMSSRADSLPLLVNDEDGEAIAALAFIVGRIDADPTASLQGSLGDWAQWLEDEGYDVSSLVALFEQLVRSQAESAPAASELVASLAPDQALNAVIRRLHEGAPTLLDAVFAHLDHGADLHARLLKLSGGSRRYRGTALITGQPRIIKSKILAEIGVGYRMGESIFLDRHPSAGENMSPEAKAALSHPEEFLEKNVKISDWSIGGHNNALIIEFGDKDSRVFVVDDDNGKFTVNGNPVGVTLGRDEVGAAHNQAQPGFVPEVVVVSEGDEPGIMVFD